MGRGTLHGFFAGGVRSVSLRFGRVRGCVWAGVIGIAVGHTPYTSSSRLFAREHVLPTGRGGGYVAALVGRRNVP